jgi:hypothetical protein
MAAFVNRVEELSRLRSLYDSNSAARGDFRLFTVEDVVGALSD